MRKVVLLLSMMFVLSMGAFASIYMILPYYWDKDRENRSLDITAVEDEFVLSSAEAHPHLWIRITDAEGTLWYEETVDVPAGTYVISVADLPDGFYQLVLTTEEGMTRTIAFVKQ